MGSYVSMEVTGVACKQAIFDELNVNSFNVKNAQPGFLGRCFIEVWLQITELTVLFVNPEMFNAYFVVYRWRMDSGVAVFH